ncbi:hypothetical protein NSMM_680005 [Nitrosomonas mobilis]|uniref:Uncharacterized protein n=1 Tax=Nitrosomonas mobilis TaxID=51642 RepID=A0A1G5SHV8_9PROT|nr:hypothetical protein NSMM_680005 [Nitrosomonas mobilis]
MPLAKAIKLFGPDDKFNAKQAQRPIKKAWSSPSKPYALKLIRRKVQASLRLTNVTTLPEGTRNLP